MTKTSFKHPHTLMIQGTTSDAGKSVLVAGICRLLKNQGKSVAPFKPQNMALNSAVTINGGEIGRSQAAQAIACGLEPHTDFNPVLLKPSSDKNAQVIIHGKAVSAMQATEYHDYKHTAMQAVLDSYERLHQQYNYIIVEGAGSPAEINLRENDIANMGFAEKIDCPVVIVADIDRGGVFAHLIGTLELLSQSEQDRVVGFVINRFRGDISLLQPGLDWLEQRTNKTVLGVLPYLHDFYLDAEDAICTQQANSEKSQFNAVVPVLPRIGNHTDFDILRLHPDVNLQFISLEQSIPPADLLILPGSKNTISDLTALKQAGWQQHIQRHLRYGGKIIGICGGYQMLGNHIHDPNGIEDKAGSTKGFGLLDIETTMMPDKQLTRMNARFIHPDLYHVAATGYEIHCGVSTLSAEQKKRSLLEFEHADTWLADGAYNTDNNVFGSYLHGLLDDHTACNAILEWAGFKTTQKVDLNTVREQQLNRLAATIEEHCKLPLID